MTSEQREMLEAAYLIKLMKLDAAVWRARISSWDCGADQPALPHELLKAAGALKRVRRIRRTEPAE
jgi:hypothetical protein